MTVFTFGGYIYSSLLSFHTHIFISSKAARVFKIIPIRQQKKNYCRRKLSGYYLQHSQIPCVL